MILLQPDATVINNIKCSFSTLHSNKLIEDEYLINICKKSKLDNKSFKETVREKYLQIFLLENIQFLNKIDDFGNQIINCDLNTIYNL